MYLLGHMAMGYLFAYAVTLKTHRSLSLWLALLAGILPDFDIFFSGLGLVHHTYTHSLILVIPVAVACILLVRGSLPYVVGVLQHLLVGDFLVNSIPVLLPFGTLTIGLGLGMPSAADALIEFGSLVMMVLVMTQNGDLGRLMNGERVNILMLIPLLSMFSLTWLAAGTPELGGLVTYGLSRLALAAITIGQGLLAVIMACSVVVSLRRRATMASRARPTMAPA